VRKLSRKSIDAELKAAGMVKFQMAHFSFQMRYSADDLIRSGNFLGVTAPNCQFSNWLTC
jgi:hypothetical protein